MQQQGLLAVIAVSVGVIVGIGLFVPFVAVSYRRRGRLSLARLLLWFAALVYFWAIWAYTLLPLPDPETIRCVGAIIDPMAMVRDVQQALAAPGNPLTHPALLQLAFNVLLFVPLGFFLRVLGGRSVVTALVVGFGLSLLIELTQLTGVWGVYACAYRFFDVGDLLSNTTGAVLGSFLALLVPRSHRGFAPAADAGEPRPVTRARRALAMLCDGIGFWLAAFAASIATQLFIGYVLDDRPLMVAGEVASLVGTAAAAVLWLAHILLSGQSIGDFAVELRYTGSRLPEFIARMLRWAGGVAGLSALGLLPQPFEFLSGALLLIACAMFFVTRNGRGLPGVLSGQQLSDARERRSETGAA